MPRRKVEFRPGAFYHVYNRGHNRDPVFFETDHYFLFLRNLREFVVERSVPNGARPVLVHAYCLMPNHYHMLVELACNDFSYRMQLFGQAYVNAINRKTKRVGSLFQGPFEAKPVEDGEYLTYLSRYIHRNPVEAGLTARPSEWEFSSYREYLGTRDGTLPTTGRILREFGSREAYRKFVDRNVEPPRGFEDVLFDA